MPISLPFAALLPPSLPPPFAPHEGDGSDEVLAAISKVQEEKVAAATASLKKVLAAGSPDRMEGEIIKLAREGGVDESFLLLLEANMNMALEAGASGPAEVMRRLKSKAESEKDKQQTAPEIVLLRKLMREEDNKAREALLEEAFTPKEKVSACIAATSLLCPSLTP